MHTASQTSWAVVDLPCKNVSLLGDATWNTFISNSALPPTRKKKRCMVIYTARSLYRRPLCWPLCNVMLTDWDAGSSRNAIDKSMFRSAMASFSMVWHIKIGTNSGTLPRVRCHQCIFGTRISLKKSPSHKCTVGFFVLPIYFVIEMKEKKKKERLTFDDELSVPLAFDISTTAIE